MMFNQDMEWNHVRLELVYRDHRDVNTIVREISRAEVEADQRRRMQEAGYSDEDVESFELTSAMFQSNIVDTARKMMYTPIFVEGPHERAMRLLPPTAIIEARIWVNGEHQPNVIVDSPVQPALIS